MKSPWTCQHGNTEVRRKTDSLGRPLFIRQCLDCGGSASPFLPKSAVRAPHKLAAWDAGLEQAGRDEADRLGRDRGAEYLAEQAKQQKDFWQRYNEYLESPEWAEKRRLVLERDDYRCQGCRRRDATQVHHLTYDRVFNELLFDLVSVCGTCHRIAHPHMTEPAA